ncbi:cytochrome c oxidase subunit 3 family protein [Candidatus Endoriftia persephonae]|uniref:Nitric oxide reductase activation protein NorE n=4 Tax=Gammaproteobacteria TaxID=1236 RepID=G2FIW0_9GAMM|nr:cytochrome c oxidase subunit 3 family protein [Candidatus Endoriftia persephone]EGW53295.1 nitric oxide reductase activation protein NorE [endosymbiont of Tevnia jerichonana (vent Tica)]KRT56524.1 Heme/copper-type cytochrome/quinol oxidase, subunit 3 [endosymbiont of Ridgeia piscesae]KRT59605.1 nitric oxide reductase NorE protein [endosymbiont of Ridgeia piscesae]USF87785.1 cytochrome c oxidase subunit 3 family protein [Candidatus Endoriftia persephone]
MTTVANSLDQAKRYPPGDLAIWIFILAELSVFAVFFAAYAFTRMNNVELFNEFQQHLDRQAALINTLALITSSYFVVRAVSAIREGSSKLCVRWLLAALSMGVVFLVVKGGEYAHHFGEGITLSTNTFYMFYLSLTFFHFMHVIMGMVILSAVAVMAHKGKYSAGEHTGVETGASYWHMVDLLWLILFPLVYVMR